MRLQALRLQALRLQAGVHRWRLLRLQVGPQPLGQPTGAGARQQRQEMLRLPLLRLIGEAGGDGGEDVVDLVVQMQRPVPMKRAAKL